MEMEEEKRLQAQTLSGINFVLGAWLVVTPYVFNYFSSAARWNQTIFGIAVIVFSAIRYAAPRFEWPSWLNALTALWLIIAPWVLSYVSGVAYWNEVVVGVLVAIFALWNMSVHPRATYSRQH